MVTSWNGIYAFNELSQHSHAFERLSQHRYWCYPWLRARAHPRYLVVWTPWTEILMEGAAAQLLSSGADCLGWLSVNPSSCTSCNTWSPDGKIRRWVDLLWASFCLANPVQYSKIFRSIFPQTLNHYLQMMYPTLAYVSQRRHHQYRTLHIVLLLRHLT
jgi:hypothetical protein